MAENDTGTAAPVESSPSLTSMVGEMYGDYSDAEPDSDAGAPPATSPDAAERSEGPADSAPTGTPPVAADPIARPDDSTTEPLSDVDPLDGATPLAYTVDGTPRSYEGITVLKDGGAIIDPDALEKVARIFGERDHLFEQGQAQHQRFADLERATTWQTRDAQGNVTALTGHAALEAQRSVLAKSLTRSTLLDSVFNDPQQASALVDIAYVDPQNPDAGVQLVWKADGIANLRTRLELAETKADIAARAHLAQLAKAPAQSTPEPSVADVANVTIASFEQAHGITGLTDADRTMLAKQLDRYVITTPQGRQVDPQFLDVMKDRAALRASSTAQVTAAADAATRNAPRLAAAAIGKRTAPQAPRIAPAVTPEPSREDDFDTHWERRERASAGALRSHASGR